MIVSGRRSRSHLVLLCLVAGSILVLLSTRSPGIVRPLGGLFPGAAHTGGEKAEEEEEEKEVSSTTTFIDHPIKVLVEQAEADFSARLARQSRTYEAAAAEYVRRYDRTPPPGFQHWFEYATAENSPIIDDFDTLDAAIAPFLTRSGAEIRQSIQDMHDSPDSRTWSCKVHSGRLLPGCENLGEAMLRLFGDARILPHLPDVELIVNALDEPRLLLPNAPTSRVRRDASLSYWTNLAHHDVWSQVVTEQCERQQSGVRRTGETSPNRSTTPEIPNLPFIQGTVPALDLCRHPEYRDQHGFFSSPVSFLMTHAPLPILSPGVPSTMGDIPFPATAYSSDMFAYDAGEDLAWEEKVPGLYWAGKTTGGEQKGGADEAWKQLHRQRFVSLANHLEPQSYTYLQRTDDADARWEAVERDFLNTSSYQAYFTDVVHCDGEDTCKAIGEHFGIHEPDPRAQPFKFALNFDTDGNGHSGRYYRLLASNSLPLKQTVFREWHDDLLQPWLHYVPVSLGLRELPELVRYLLEEDEGRALAPRLAAHGQEWSRRALRPVDQLVYLYRLMLELARVQDPARSAEG